MNLLQVATAILFFYVFGLGAILLTWYTIRSIKEFIEGGQGMARKPAKSSPPEGEDDNSIKLHISEGLIEVSRLPEEKTEK